MRATVSAELPSRGRSIDGGGRGVKGLADGVVRLVGELGECRALEPIERHSEPRGDGGGLCTAWWMWS